MVIGWKKTHMTNANRYLAHVRRNDDGSFAIHDLEDHLRPVGGRNILSK